MLERTRDLRSRPPAPILRVLRRSRSVLLHERRREDGSMSLTRMCVWLGFQGRIARPLWQWRKTRRTAVLLLSGRRDSADDRRGRRWNSLSFESLRMPS